MPRMSEAEYRTLLLRIAARFAGAVTQAYVAFIAQLERRAAGIDTTNLEAVLGLLDARSASRKLDPLYQALQGTADAASRIVARFVGQRLRINVPAAVSRARTVAWVRREGGKQIKALTESVRETVREILENGIEQGLGRAQIASRIRREIGLTPAWSKAVETYRAERLVAGDTERQAQVLANKYARALKKRRGLNIGRTETMRASREAEASMTEELVENGTLDPLEYEGEWVGILRDGRICEICYGLHGSRRKLPDGVYPNGSDRAEGHDTNCRCQEAIVAVGAPATERPPFVEPADGGSLRPAVPK